MVILECLLSINYCKCNINVISFSDCPSNIMKHSPLFRVQFIVDSSLETRFRYLPGWPGAQYIGHVVLELTDAPASSS